MVAKDGFVGMGGSEYRGVSDDGGSEGEEERCDGGSVDVALHSNKIIDENFS